MPPKEIVTNLLTDDFRGRKVKGEILKNLLREVAEQPEKLEVYLASIDLRVKEFPR